VIVASQLQPTEVVREPVMDKDENSSLDILSEFGLTDNQAKVFLATTKLGTPTVAEVADASGVRREEIYRLLPELEKIGLIERLLGKPLRLKSLDPKASITTLVDLEKERAKDRIELLSTKSKKLLKLLGHREVVSHHEEMDSEFSLIQEKESIRVGLSELITKTEKQLDILFSRKDLIWLVSTQGEALQHAYARGVKIRIMSEPTTTRDRIPKILHRQFPGKAEVPLRYFLQPNAFYIIADSSQLILITTGAQHLPSATCLWTNNQSLVSMTASSFEEHWHDSVHWKNVDGINLSVAQQERCEERGVHVHRVLLYRSIEVKEKVLLNFLKEHYEAQYLVIYVCVQDCIDDAKKSMHKFGFDPEMIDDPKNLRLLNWNQLIMKNEEYSVDKAIDVWDELIVESQNLGFEGVAIASDMKFFFDNDMIEELIDYEKHLHKMAGEQMELMCAYEEKLILERDNPLWLYGRLIGHHTALLTEEKGSIKRSYRDI
jgi:sugar-specific transcriptional regulator TrmB